ncbi:hypothetical protein ACFQZJ_11140 [Maribacter chungangensis]|uniref:Uncharacterized protein n=1 Tax=Maribacter chungangensis TaxID=1069117 RepID=A0ABW3B4F0_9FLAO
MKHDLENIAHFLCINSEAITLTGLQGKMGLLYFLFSHGNDSKKQSYVDFSFELLEECLSEELLKIQSSKNESIDFDIQILELAWSLQKFISMGFFECEDSNPILEPFDKMVVQEAEKVKNKPLLKETLCRTVFIYDYLSGRLPLLKSGSLKYLKIASTLESLFPAVNNSELIETEFPMVSTLIKKDVNFNLEVMTKLTLTVQYIDDQNDNDKDTGQLPHKVKDAMGKLYKDPKKGRNLLLNKIIMGGNLILNLKKEAQQEFLAYYLFSNFNKNN